MNRFRKLDSQLDSEGRSTWRSEDAETAEGLIPERALRQYRKLVAEFDEKDWRAAHSTWFKKPEPWQKRFAWLLTHADPASAAPILMRMIQDSEKKLATIAGNVLEGLDVSKTGLPTDPAYLAAIARFNQLLSERKQTLKPVDTATGDLALRFKARIYQEKTLKVARFLAWAPRPADVYLAGDSKSLKQIADHVKAGAELAQHFGQARRTYLCTTPTPQELASRGRVKWLRALHVEIRNVLPAEMGQHTVHVDEKDEATVTIGVETVPEMALILSGCGAGYLEPPYEGWPILQTYRNDKNIGTLELFFEEGSE